MCGRSKVALWASVAANTLSTGTGDCDYFCCGDAIVSWVLFYPLPLIFLKAQYYRYRRLRRSKMLSSAVIIKHKMEKKAAKTSGSRPNPRNGSVQRHRGDMTRSGRARRPVPLNFNLQQEVHHHEKNFRRRSSQTQKTWEASVSFSSSKLKNNTTVTMRRPKTQPELLNQDQWKHTTWTNNRVDQALGANKLLVNVTVERSIGSLRALLSNDATVEDAIKATLVLYAEEGRKPSLTNDPTLFGLHYSQFSITCLDPRDKLKDLGSRTFFLCSKDTTIECCGVSVHGGETVGRALSSSSSCGREITEPWYNKLMVVFCHRLNNNG